MPEWLIERGIGETRAALIDQGEIVEARIELEGIAAAGSVIAARLTDVGAEGRNAVARDQQGNEYLLPRGAPGTTEGAALHVEVTREEIPGSEPWKRPLARATGEMVRTAPQLTGRALAFPAPTDALGEAGWDELIDQARSGIVAFGGGELRISPTPAMTLIDVDGTRAPHELALAGAEAAARAIRRLAICGSIGIDLPTVAGKRERQAIGEAVDAILPQPFERTAVNGFGFTQIVRPRPRASMLELAQDRAAFEARALLRRCAFGDHGRTRLVAHPAVIAVLEAKPDWLDALARQTGGAIELRAESGLPMFGGYAEPS